MRFDCSIIIGTYGEDSWRTMAEGRALPSAQAQSDHEVIVGHHPEGTISSVRNALAEKASGNYLCFLDADDELDDGYLWAMQRAHERRFSEYPLLLLTPAVSYVNPNGRRQQPKFWPGRDLSRDNYLVVGTVLPKELFMKVGGFGEYPHGFEDWSLWAKCWKEGASIVKVPRAIYIAYINPESKHRLAWKDRQSQLETHRRVQRDIFPELEL